MFVEVELYCTNRSPNNVQPRRLATAANAEGHFACSVGCLSLRSVHGWPRNFTCRPAPATDYSPRHTVSLRSKRAAAAAISSLKTAPHPFQCRQTARLYLLRQQSPMMPRSREVRDRIADVPLLPAASGRGRPESSGSTSRGTR